MVVISSNNEHVIARWRQILQAHYPLVITTTLSELMTQLNGTPRTVILHESFFDNDGEEQIQQLVKQFNTMRFLILSDRPDENTAFMLLHSGAYGYSNTYIAEKLLLDAVSQINQGEVWMGKRLTRYLSECLIEDINNETTEDNAIRAEYCLARLTAREKEVAKRIAHGCSNKCVAKALNITERTVKAHLSSIFQKSGIKDRVHLALILNSHKYD